MAHVLLAGLSASAALALCPNLFVRLLGKRTLGLGYSMVATDLVLAPAIPSITGSTPSERSCAARA